MIIFTLGEKIKKFNHSDFESIYDYNSVTRTVNELKRIQNSFVMKKRVIELFEFENISLWWFFYPELFSQFFKLINFINNFSNFIKKIKPNSVKIADDFFYFEIIKQICESLNIKLDYSKSDLLKFNLKEKTKFKARKYKVKFLFSSRINNRLKLFSNQKSSSYSINNKILFTTYAIYRRGIFNFEKGVTENGEFLIQYFIDLLNKKYQVKGIDIFSYSFPKEDALKERLNSKMEWIPLEIFHKVYSNEKNQNEFITKFTNIIKSADFQNLFKYYNISFWKQISQDFEKMKFDYAIPYWIKTINSLQKAFLNEKPRSIFLVYETGPLSLAIIATCQKLGIKTIGIQHGIIHSFHPHYMHDEFLSSNNKFGFPIPDHLLLFGKIPKHILEKRGYPINKLVVFGNPSFFNLTKIQNYLKNESLYEKYHLDKNKKIILYLSGGFQLLQQSEKFNYDLQVCKHLIEKIADNDKFTFVLKPHPHEKTDSFEKILKKQKLTNVKIIQGNLLELISISSVVISIASTSLIDSMCLKKPSIQLIFDDAKFVMPYDDYDAVLKSKLNTLLENIQKIIKDENLQQKLLEQGHKFVKDYYNIDETNQSNIIKKILS